MTLVTVEGPDLTCPVCKTQVHILVNGSCGPCNEASRVKMAIRQDASKFDAQRLVNLTLTQHWMHECEIIPDYMLPFPSKNTQPTCQVRYVYKDGTETYLRYGNGPLPDYFWDMYGDDMRSPELALLAISRAPPPGRIGRVILTYGE